VRSGIAVIAATVRSAVIAFALVVTMGLVLGASHRITPGWYLGWEVVVLVAAAGALAVRTQKSGSDPGATSVSGGGHRAVVVGVWVAIVAFVIGMGISNSPLTAYDAVSYHLFFPARWLQAHRLFIVPTPFSDEAQAYQPGNGELWFLWLMLPFHSDLLARIGQVPFYLAGAAATYLIALRAGASRQDAAYAPTLFLIAPPIVEQAVGANVDLIAASMFVCAIWLGIVAADTNRRRDWALWGCATGLFVGTKYLAVVYAPVLVLVALLPKPRLRLLWGVPGVVALGAPWYIRNWIVAGSPLYPTSLTLAGVPLGRGAYTHEAMLQSFMHTTSLRLLAVSLVHALGTNFFLVVAPLALAAVAGAIARRRWWPSAAVVIAIAWVIALCWVAVGDNTDARFLLPAVALSPALVPLAFGSSPRWNAVLHAWLIAGVVWVLVGVDRQLALSLPWFMADWLPLRGVIDPRFVLSFFVLAAIGAGVYAAASRVRVAAAAAVLLTLASSAVLATGARRWCPGGLCEFVQIDDPHIRQSYRYATHWLLEHARHANVAYAGNNLPYPLSGSDLTNTVHYVNIDSHLSWRFDQYARAYARGEIAASAPSLAQPSGVLMPARSQDAVRPRFERRAGDPEEWKMNLRRERIGYLFVSRLDSYEVDYQWHDARGFPIEDEWARKSPDAFTLAYANDDVRVYEVSLPMTDLAR
jgi:hypothetical protein